MRSAPEPVFSADFFRALEVLARRRHARTRGTAAEPRAGSARMGFEHRAWQPGDDARRVDWRASARSPRVQVRRREEERGGELLLVLDRSASLCPQHARRDLDQRRLALAAGWLALEAGASVRLVAGDRAVQAFGGFERRVALQRALEALPAPAGADARPAWDALGPAPGRRALACGDPWGGAGWWRALAAAPAAGARELAILVLPEEDEPPATGLRVRDVETGATRTVALGGAARGRFARAWARHLEELRAHAHDCGWRPAELRLPRAAAPAGAILRVAEEAGLV